MTDTIKISRDELQRIAQGCSCEVTTDALDALLATPPADAADMGGQAGEEVEVVASLHAEHTQDNIGEYAFVVESHAWLKACRRTGGEFDLVPAAQHRRILAQHRKQAGKLAEALRSCTRAKSAAEVGLIVDEALADWEKTK